MTRTTGLARLIERNGTLVLALLAPLLLFPGVGQIPLLDRDEPRFARATVEMIERADWIVPYFNGEYRFDKPVLTYWLMRAGYALFGIGETGARFHSLVAAAATAVLICITGRRWFGPRAGWWAGFGFLTCLQVQLHGRSAVADMPMAFFVTAAMIAMWELLSRDETRPYPWRWFLTFHGALGLGFLAKGPVALAVPLLAGLLWRFLLHKRPAPWRNLRLPAGLPLMLAIMGAWGIPALIQTGGLFWKVGIGEHVVERGASAFNGRTPMPFYYLGTVFVSLFPWSACLGHAWQAVRLQRDSRNLFLAAWFLAPVLIFSLYATQLMHYILPGFAAFFLLLAQQLEAKPIRRWIEILRGTVLMLFSLAPALAIAALRVFAWPPPVPLTFCLLGVFLLVYGLSVVGQPMWPWLRALALGAVAGGALTLGIGLRQWTPSLQIARVAGPTEPAAFYRYREPSLVFYSGRNWETLKKIEDAQAFLAQPGPRTLVVQDDERPIVGTKGAKSFATEVATLPTNDCPMFVVEGINVARGKIVTVRVIRKP